MMEVSVAAVELAQNGTFRSVSCRPGARAMAPTMAAHSIIKAYMRREEVEFLQDGQALQQQETAVPVQQQASCG